MLGCEQVREQRNRSFHHVSVTSENLSISTGLMSCHTRVQRIYGWMPHSHSITIEYYQTDFWAQLGRGLDFIDWQLVRWTSWIFGNWLFSIITTITFKGGLLNSRKSRGLKLARIPKLAIILFHILTQWRRYISLDFLFTCCSAHILNK